MSFLSTLFILYSLVLVAVCIFILKLLFHWLFSYVHNKTLSVNTNSICSVVVKVILWLQDWACPPCRGLCNCSICRTREGKKPTGILVPFVKSEGYNSVKEYLQFEEDWQTDTVLTDTLLRVTSESQSHCISLCWIVPMLPYIIECQSIFCITFGF